MLDRLGERSFGILLLLLALLSLVPGASGLMGVLILVPAVQMILARPSPVLPRFIAKRGLRVDRLSRMLRRAVPLLVRIERFIKPRWATPFEATKRVVGAVVLLLAATIIAPIPLSNFVPGIVTALVALAYLEEDGLFLSFALAAAAVSLAITGAEVWAAVGAAKWLAQLW